MRSDMFETPMLLDDKELDAVAAGHGSLIDVDVDVKDTLNDNNINVISVGDVDQRQ